MKKYAKKYLTRPVCLILSLVVLSGALTVAALTGSPYETVKAAAWETLFAPSGRYTMEVKGYLDGELHPEANTFVDVSYSENASLSVASNGDNNAYSFSNRDYWINPTYVDEDGRQWYSVSRTSGGDYYPMYGGLISNFGGVSRGDRSVRFADLLVDFLVGDLKNNFSISEKDGVKTISTTLTAAQIPELYNAGLSLFAGQMDTGGRYDEEVISETETEVTYRRVILDGKTKTVQILKSDNGIKYDMTRTEFENNFGYFNEKEYQERCSYRTRENEKMVSETKTEAVPGDYGDALSVPMDSAWVEYVSGTAAVAKDGYLSGVDGTLRVGLKTVFGETHEVELKVKFTRENIETSEVECPIPDMETVFTPERFAEAYVWKGGGSLYFALNEDGTVDTDSIRSDLEDMPLVAFDEMGDSQDYIPKAEPTIGGSD